jgi:DNA-binding HxlR family transcriptional regulator
VHESDRRALDPQRALVPARHTAPLLGAEKRPQSISAKTLSARLRKLEGDGVVLRDVKPTSPPTVEYRLTPLGARLIPAVEAIVDVGNELKRLRHIR